MVWQKWSGIRRSYLDQILNLMLESQDPKNKEIISQLFGAIKLTEAIACALNKVDKSIYTK